MEVGGEANVGRDSVVEGEGRVMLDNDVGSSGLSELASTSNTEKK